MSPGRKLTNAVVEKSQPRDRAYFIWCGQMRGFGVRVSPTGRRVYYADLTTKEGRRHRLAIGAHGKLTSDQARDLAVLMFADVIAGGDPATDRFAKRNALTMNQLCDRYIEALDRGLILGKGGRAKKASTIVSDKSRIQAHIRPLLGRKPVRQVTRVLVNQFLEDVTTGQTSGSRKTENLRGKSIVTGGAGQASRTVGLLGGIFTYAVAQGLAEHNPVAGVRRPADQKRKRRLSVAEYKALGKALRAAAEEGERPQLVDAIWLLALSGCRSGEIGGLRWAEVDTERSRLCLANTKEGRSERPVGKPFLDYLARIDRRPDTPFVLPGVHTTKHYGGITQGWERIAKRAGFTGISPHTLRHAFGSVAGDLGIADSLIAEFLGHSHDTTTNGYVHRDPEVKTAAADRVASTIYARMGQ